MLVLPPYFLLRDFVARSRSSFYSLQQRKYVARRVVIRATFALQLATQQMQQCCATSCTILLRVFPHLNTVLFFFDSFSCSTKRNSGFTEAGAVSSIQFSRTVTGLIPSTTYNFKVMAFTTVGDGPFSDVVSATTNASGKSWAIFVLWCCLATCINLKSPPPQSHQKGIILLCINQCL